MFLVSEQDFKEMQENALKSFYSDFLGKLETDTLVDTDYESIRFYIVEIMKIVLLGQQEYLRFYSIVENIMLDRKQLMYFSTVHSKQEILDFVRNNN